MAGQVFGELQYEDDYGWSGKQTLDFGGNTCTVDIWVQYDEDDEEEQEITERQENAYKCFMEKWPELQENLIEALIKYYNEEERFSHGPDDEEKMAEWWPEIQTKEALLQAVTLETIVVAYDFKMEDGRYIYLLFSRKWGGEDWNDNGIGVCYINEEIDEINYKIIAY